MSKELKIKDLVNIGVFFIIYFLTTTVVAGLGGIGVTIPLYFLCWPAIAGIVSGTVAMLFMAKEPKPFAFFIFGILHSVVSVILGHHFIIIIISLIFLGIAELVLRKGEYKSFKYVAVAYGLLSASLSGPIMQILVVKEHYVDMLQSTGNDMTEFIETLEKLVSWPVLGLVILGGFIGGIIGAFIGKKMLKKHFEKAGII